MPDPLRVSDLRFSEASEADARTGVIGWVRFIVNDALSLDGVVLRRTASGRMTLSFPARRDGRGIQRFFVRPITDEARRELERQVFERLHLDREAAP
jgi:hypothetical protein